MSSSFLTPPGTRIDVDALAVPKAVELANALRRRSIGFADLVETLETDGGEVVVFDVEVELPQVRINPIKRLERIAAIFPLGGRRFARGPRAPRRLPMGFAPESP